MPDVGGGMFLRPLKGRLQGRALALIASVAVVFDCGVVADSLSRAGPLAVENLTVSSGANLSHLLVDGDPASYWYSSALPGPGRRQWVRLAFGRHLALDSVVLSPSPEGGFPTGLEVLYSTDGGQVWYRVAGASFSNYPDPGSEPVRIQLHSVVADALMLQANYLSKDRQGRYTFQLAEVEVEGSEPGPFFTSRGGSWDADLDMMWKIFGSASDGSAAVPAMGGESAWMEWNALKLCWFPDESLRQFLRNQFTQYTVEPDGYIWSWGDQEGWPTHGHRHYDSNPKYILGACRYFLWCGDEGFLQTSTSPTTDMAFGIRYEGTEPVRWDAASHMAVRLERDRTIGQSFDAARMFTAVGGSFPTYVTAGSGMTLRLLKGGLGGELVAERAFADVLDNAWVMLEVGPQAAGRYYLEMCCPVGTIGWWSINDDAIPGGQAYRDGQAVERDPRTLLERLRSAMDFQLDQLDGREGLMVISDPASNGTYNGFPTDYWDNFPFGYKSAYANIYFYASLAAMTELEDAMGNAGRAAELRALRPLVKRRFNEEFWDDAKGRYVGCVDARGEVHDYGFTYVNTEAIAYGLADEEKARRIYSWLDGSREIAGDYSKGKDIYRYVVAPRSSTIPVESVEPHWWYDINGAISIGPGGRANYDEHLENGGVIFYTSFYDLVSRLLYISPDDALTRLDAIMAEFHKDQLRRDPPNGQGVAWKLGIIGEFPESGLVPAFLVHGFLGACAGSDGLHISPRLPSKMPYVGVRDLWFRGSMYTITASREAANASIMARAGGYDVVVPNGRHVLVVDGTVRELGNVEPPLIDVREGSGLGLVLAALAMCGGTCRGRRLKGPGMSTSVR